MQKCPSQTCLHTAALRPTEGLWRLGRATSGRRGMSVSLLPKGMRVPSPPKAAHDGPPEAAYYHGFCSRTLASSGCRPRAQKGSWALDAHEATNWTVASDACFRRCAACDHCAYFSVGLKFRDCGWFRPNACELGGMSDYPRGFRRAFAPSAWPRSVR